MAEPKRLRDYPEGTERRLEDCPEFRHRMRDGAVTEVLSTPKPSEVDRLRACVEELEALNDKLAADNDRLRANNGELGQRGERYAHEIRTLERRLERQERELESRRERADREWTREDVERFAEAAVAACPGIFIERLEAKDYIDAVLARLNAPKKTGWFRFTRGNVEFRGFQKTKGWRLATDASGNGATVTRSRVEGRIEDAFPAAVIQWESGGQSCQ